LTAAGASPTSRAPVAAFCDNHFRENIMHVPRDMGTALITGASSGIGAIYADRLAHRGYDLVLVGRNVARLDALATRLDDETTAGIQCIATDLAEPEGVQRVEDLLRSAGNISMLVNNAGTGLVAPTLQSDILAQRRMIDLNVTALMRLSQAAAVSFVRRNAGAIINIASVVALAPELLNGVYSASKAFVLAYSQALRQELMGTNVRLQVVMPGATATGFWETAGSRVQELPSSVVMSAETMVDAALAGFDLGEFATIPSLPDITDWEYLEEVRRTLQPKLSLARPASRYAFVKPAAA
jgi:short-subunit dehydrogenase